MRILVVEDDQKIANALKKGLEQESYAVDVEYEGEGGLGSALVTEYDLIILDRMLPGGIDGADICKKIREEGKATPVLILTAKEKVDEKVYGLNSGADDYLIKPFALDELLARVRALLRRPPQINGNVLVYEDLKMDTVRRIVQRKGREIPLTIKEYSLLEYIMRNQGRILSKENIIEHVWNFDADVLPNTVEVYVSYLRDKIEKPFGKNKIIKTIRGYGYRMGDNNAF